MNEDLLNPNVHNLKDILILNSLNNVISEPTRQHALLDPIIIHNDMSFLHHGILEIPPEISDHSATYLYLPFQYPLHRSFTRKVWLYKNANFELLNNKILQFDWTCLNQGSVNDASTLFNNIFIEFVKVCIPCKSILVREDDKPWYDSEIRRNTRKRDRQKKKAVKTGNITDWIKYKRLRNKVNNQRKHAKESFYNNLELIITDFENNDKRKFWKVIRHFVENNSSSSAIPPLSSTLPSGETQWAFTDEAKADCLNDYFVSISTVNDENTVLPPFEKLTNNSLSTVNCTENEIENLINVLNINKASGDDGISHRMLKGVAKSISKPLSILMNRSFNEGIFPEAWKVANVIPIFKKGDKSLPSNYRPVALLSCLGKLQERIVFKNLYNFLIDNNLLYKYQSGFLPHHSTVFQLIDIYHNICQAIDNNLFSCIVFCDVSKAFDRVWHRGLLFKLRQNGIDGKLLQWLNSYLTNRKQKVTLKSCASTIKSILAGVPQGSVLGPLLFLVYINDIAKQLLSLTRLFADDSSLFYAAARLSDIAGIINHDLIMLSNWAIQWLVKFNPLKTEAVLFTLKYFEAFPQLIFDNTPIKFVEDHKHLGITFSQNGQWHTHIEQIANTASKILGIMRILKYTLSRNALNQIYLYHLLPIIEYASLVWDGCTQQDSNTLQKIQNEAARIVTGLTRSVSLVKLYNECGWTNLSVRRHQQKLHFMYKVNNGLVPSYITDLFPPLVSEISGYPLRNNNNFSTPFTRTNISLRSCIPSAIRMWNTLDEGLKNQPTISSFKNNLQITTFPKLHVPNYFTSGNRYLSVIHARIRNNCSNLNNDLFINHLRENPLCNWCNEIEDSEHYFFHCNNYRNERHLFFEAARDFQPLTTQLLLYGNEIVDNTLNSTLFRAVHDYIKSTKRFDNT